MIAERSVDEWYSSLPKTSGIYRLINGTMGDRGEKERIWAVIALGESDDPRAVRPLMDCCADKDPQIRLHATEALFKLRSGRAVSVLVERLRDKNERLVTRERAAAALAAVRSYTAIEGLRDLYADTDEDPALRSFVAEELHRIRIR
ncbi:MAG: HEAT repeat domain-containing protein [Methanoregula sp.]